MKAAGGSFLAQRVLDSLPGQHESMADRMAVFTEDVLGASGSAEERTSARYNLLDATRLRDQNFVALVLGGDDRQTRERIFSGFNTPLLPEVLICTSVGAEGIDLHRHCRRIVHYDLAWNPAVLEQRTGRVDRIGSKIFREREAANDGQGPSLEVGIPFLAGTYDERMFEELRMRAQTFEVLSRPRCPEHYRGGFSHCIDLVSSPTRCQSEYFKKVRSLYRADHSFQSRRPLVYCLPPVTAAVSS
jgi:superfamily II DNA/RNA helicase